MVAMEINPILLIFSIYSIKLLIIYLILTIIIGLYIAAEYGPTPAIATYP
jgi:hypothetical protein